MTLIRWSPMRELATLQNEVDRLFTTMNRTERDGGFFPPVDVVETEEEYIVRAELPGMRQEDIKVNLADNTVSLKGEKRYEKEEKKTNFYHSERGFGTFERSFTLGTPVQSDKIRARYMNGVLEVVLPKSDQVRPKDIKIE